MTSPDATHRIRRHCCWAVRDTAIPRINAKPQYLRSPKLCCATFPRPPQTPKSHTLNIPHTQSAADLAAARQNLTPETSTRGELFLCRCEAAYFSN